MRKKTSGRGRTPEKVIDMKDERDRLRATVPAIVEWYEDNRKPLPWRDDPTPYHVWLSEIMLQQTRIEAVIPYYERFLAELPDLASLAEAEDDRLMKLWQGLGYYSRARNLKKTAILLVREGGEFPSDAAKLRALPGIGEYTAGAIASIAFGQPEPAVDGNVLRVVMRLCACSDDVTLPATKKAVFAALRAVYPTGAAAALLTQGLMELGETVCPPAGAPRCSACPLYLLCEARERGIQQTLPVRSPKAARRQEERTVLLLFDPSGAVAVVRRPDHGLLAGLYEFFCVEKTLSEDEVKCLLEKDGFSVGSIENIGKSKHLFTHIEWNMTGYAVRCAKIPSKSDLIFLQKEDLFSQYAIPTAYRRYLGWLEANG